MAELSVSPELIVDRYYRGAILCLGTTSFAVSEEMVRLIERLSADARAVLSAEEEELAALLLERGVLQRSAS